MAFSIGEPDAVWLLSLTDLPELSSMTTLEGGWANTNSLLTLGDGSKVVLKAWNANTVDEVALVVGRHCHLDSHGIPTPVPIELDGGGMHAERGGVAWTLLPYFEGGLLGSDAGSLRSLGEVQARMHQIPPIDCFPEIYTMGFEFFDEIFALAEDRDDWSPFLDLLRDEATSLKRLLPEDLPPGVLHGDLFPDNVIGRGGSVAAILDLEEAWLGPCIFDLVMSFVGFGWEGREPSEDRWRALVEGYESVRGLSMEERVALPAMHRYATLAIAGWRYWKHNLSQPDPSLSDRHSEMVDRLDVGFDFMEAFD
jgi:homoserine kinase type II